MSLIPSSRCRLSAIGILLSIGLLGCANQPSVLTEVDEQINLPNSFSLPGQDLIQEKWWLAFHDEKLNTLIDLALTNNFDLRSSFAAVQKAQAVKKQAGGDRGLNVGADFQLRDVNDVKQYTGSIEASYELDLWGELRAASDSANFDFIASQQDYRTAAISLSAEVATTWYELLAAEQALAVYQQQLTVNEDILTLAQEQFVNGVSTISDSTQQAAQVASSRAGLANQQATVQVLRHSLNVLLGREVNYPIDTESAALISLPPLPITGIPSEILAQRPDIMSQWFDIKSKQAEVAEAVASRYPSLSLGLTRQGLSASASDLFTSWSTTLIASLAVDLWTSGKNTAIIEERRASVEGSVNDYGQMVLEAVKETEDALSRERYTKQRLDHLELQHELTYQALEQLKSYYINGSSSFTAVLTSLNSAQNLDINLINVRQSLIANRISLYRTLSAGWDLPEQTR
jgi:NodT family efflux transporter outer membrane factor (OMF) lipoprotein